MLTQVIRGLPCSKIQHVDLLTAPHSLLVPKVFTKSISSPPVEVIRTDSSVDFLSGVSVNESNREKAFISRQSFSVNFLDKCSALKLPI